MKHGVGIDTGAAMIVRGGVRGSNDLVSIGSAPNIAAKLSEKRSGKTIYISKAVYDNMADVAKYSNGTNMWTNLGSETHGGKTVQTYGTTYHWTP
jgi:class 3 adenylate cyclase